MKAYSTFLFFAAMILAASLVFGLSGCSRPEKKEAPTTHQPTPPPKPQATTGPVSVDFDQAPLSDVALFITSQTGKGMHLNGCATSPISWIEYNIAKDKLFPTFEKVIASAGLILKTNGENAYTIDKAEDLQVPYQLDFATSQRGTFFFLGGKVYSQETFPFPAQNIGGHWYATIPKQLAESIGATTAKK